MKKTIALLISVTMLLGLCACSKSDSDKGSKSFKLADRPTSVESEPTSEPTTETTTEPTTKPTTEPTTEPTTVPSTSAQAQGQTIEDYYNEHDLWGELEADSQVKLSHYPEFYQDVKQSIVGNTYTLEYYFIPGLEDTLDANNYNYQDWDGALAIVKQDFYDICGIELEQVVVIYYTSEGEVFFKYDSATFVAPTTDPNGSIPTYATLEDFLNENDYILDSLCDYFGYTNTYAIGNTLFVTLNPKDYSNEEIPELKTLLDEGKYTEFVEAQFGDEDLGILGSLHMLMDNYNVILSVQVAFVNDNGGLIQDEYYTEGYHY